MAVRAESRVASAHFLIPNLVSRTKSMRKSGTGFSVGCDESPGLHEASSRDTFVLRWRGDSRRTTNLSNIEPSALIAGLDSA